MKKMRFKISDIDNEIFYQIPKSLFTNKNYKGLGSDAKVIYALLKDRMSLSRKNDWKDQNGDIFLIFRQEELSEILDLSVATVSRAMKQLVKYQLIDVIRQGLSKPNKIYINKIEAESDDDIPNEDTTEISECQNQMPVPDYIELPKRILAAEQSTSMQIKTCIDETLDLHQCKSGLAPKKVLTCTTANQDLQERESRLAPVQTNNTYNNKNDPSDTYNNNNDHVAATVDLNVVVQDCLLLGLKEPAILNLVDTYGVEALQRQLYHLSLAKIENNAAGWLYTALKNDFKLSKQQPKQKNDAPAFLPRQTIQSGRAVVQPYADETQNYMEEVEKNIEINENSTFARLHKADQAV